MPLRTPVVFVIFNRPDTTSRVFEAVRKVQPERLLVVADGPRPDRQNEDILVAETRAIVDRVDWPCELLKDYSDRNLGCNQRIASGLNWAFSQVDEAIILEDDCLPDPTFFSYCSELLERYRQDQRVMTISGANFLDVRHEAPYSYYFSKFTHLWGWASWRRAWAKFDLTLEAWPDFACGGGLRSIADNVAEEYYWTRLFERSWRGAYNSWDFAWMLSCWLDSGLAIVPNVNLVSNIGFGVNGTHAKTADNPLACRPTRRLENLKHPPNVVRNAPADSCTFRKCYYRETVARKLRRYVRQCCRALRPAA